MPDAARKLERAKGLNEPIIRNRNIHYVKLNPLTMKHVILIIALSLLLVSCCSLFRVPKYCPSDADFTSDKSIISENETVQFTDMSYGDPESWHWTFQGGNPVSSSDANPRVIYPSEGTYPVSLTIRNRFGTNTENKSSFIIVEREIECKEESFLPGPFTRLCPTHIDGDREYNGHGPEVEASAMLRIVNEKEIYVDLYLHEKETRSDWTECLGNWSRRIYTAPSNWKIKRILTDLGSTTAYRDTDHDLDVPTITGGRLVRKFEIMGDTGGNDVGNCTAGDAYMNVYFNDVKLEVCEDASTL